MRPFTNIALIGMPGVGKSTAGVLAAKALSMGFVDTDLLIQSREARRLQTIIERRGIDRFLEIEREAILSLCVEDTVIATGGSAVYSESAMEDLRSTGAVIHLDLPLADLERRALRLDERGVVRPPGHSLADLYAERHPLYERWADVHIATSGKDLEAVAGEIVETVRRLRAETS